MLTTRQFTSFQRYHMRVKTAWLDGESRKRQYSPHRIIDERSVAESEHASRKRIAQAERDDKNYKAQQLKFGIAFDALAPEIKYALAIEERKGYEILLRAKQYIQKNYPADKSAIVLLNTLFDKSLQRG